MKRLLSVFIVIFLSKVTFGQAHVAIDPSQNIQIKISNFTKKIGIHHSQKRIVKLLFKNAHKVFLKKYCAYSTLSDVFQEGKYDCLSGTYLLSLALDQLNIKHRIIETNYHIFLIAETNQGDILLESTDQVNGFISNKKQLEEQIAFYKNDGATKNQFYLSGIKIFHEILAPQLSGLQFFNQSVLSFHQNNLEASCKFLESAWMIYDNPRVYEFTPILIQTILKSGLAEQEKRSLVSLLQSHQNNSINTLATR